MIELTPEQAERLRAHMEKSDMMAEARQTDAVKERLADIRKRLINGEGTTQIINALHCSGRLRGCGQKTADQRRSDLMADEIPHIFYSKESGDGLKTSKFTLEVRGITLDECRKHFDEILRGVKDE